MLEKDTVDTEGKGDSKETEEVSEDESFVSDGESHDLKVPCMGQVHYLRCACIFKCVLWTLTVLFQTLPLAWIVLMAMFFSQAPSFITWMLNPGIGLCGTIEIIFSGVTSALALVQLLQKGQYAFVHKCRVIFNVVLAAFLSHLLVFFGLSFAVHYNFPKRMEKEMKRELFAYKKRGSGLHELWERTQEKYSCCGFGGDLDYDKLPVSCCPAEAEANCTKDTRWKRNCFQAEDNVGKYFLRFGTTLLGIGIPFACLFYLGFRYFRPYWDVELHTGTSVPTLTSEASVVDNDDDSGEEEGQRQ